MRNKVVVKKALIGTGIAATIATGILLGKKRRLSRVRNEGR